LTPEDVPGGVPSRREFEQLSERLGDVENEMLALKDLPAAVARNTGSIQTLISLVQAGFDGIGKPLERPTDAKSAIQFAAVVIVPVLVALIGGYFVLQAAGAAHGR
jgi:hypothetical protein